MQPLGSRLKCWTQLFHLPLIASPRREAEVETRRDAARKSRPASVALPAREELEVLSTLSPSRARQAKLSSVSADDGHGR